MREAVAAFVRDGDRVSAACGLEARIPFAAAHEIVRQGRRDLTLLGPISDALYDQMIGAGCVGAALVAWIGNVGSGLGANFRRAVEHAIPRPLRVTDYSNLTYALGLRATAEGVPFAVTRSITGTDLARAGDAFLPVDDPFTGERVMAVRAIPVDVALVHAQRADEFGNAHVLGNLGTTLESVRAAKRTILTVEEVVSPDAIRADPNRTAIPGFLVDAVVHEPFGAHPSPVFGYSERDHAFFARYAEASRTREGFESWQHEWIDGVPDRAAYRRKLR